MPSLILEFKIGSELYQWLSDVRENDPRIPVKCKSPFMHFQHPSRTWMYCPVFLDHIAEWCDENLLGDYCITNHRPPGNDPRFVETATHPDVKIDFDNERDLVLFKMYWL